MTNDKKIALAIDDIEQDIFEFNIRYTPCPECGGRCYCMRHCDTHYWPTAGTTNMSHPRYELAKEGREIKDRMRDHVLTKLRDYKAEEDE